MEERPLADEEEVLEDVQAVWCDPTSKLGSQEHFNYK